LRLTYPNETGAPEDSRNRKRKPDDPEQFERAVETSGKIGVDENSEAFERALDKIVLPKRSDRKSTH